MCVYIYIYIYIYTPNPQEIIGEIFVSSKTLLAKTLVNISCSRGGIPLTKETPEEMMHVEDSSREALSRTIERGPNFQTTCTC